MTFGEHCVDLATYLLLRNVLLVLKRKQIYTVFMRNSG